MGTEKVEGDVSHAYNSVFACSPDGTVTTYQKIHPTEGAWCVAGENPLVLDTKWGKVGVSICYDTYYAPEIERCYAMEGCKLLLNSTATRDRDEFSGGTNIPEWEWFFSHA